MDVGSWVIYQFCAQLAIGSMLITPLVSFEETGRAFPRFMAILGILFLSLAGAVRIAALPAGVRRDPGLAAAGSLLVSLIAFFPLLRRWPAGWARIYLALSQALLGGWFLATAASSAPEARVSTPIWHVPGLAASTLLLGTANAAMLLGHWYLVLPKLSLEPFRSLTLAFAAALLLKAASVAAALFAAGPELLPLTSWGGHGMFLAAGLGVGLLLPLACIPLIWQTVRMGATQSATGILYIATVFVIIGDLIGKYLFTIHRLAL